MSISAMKQALEALALVASSDEWLGCQTYEGQIATSAYEALRQAIEQAEKQEPVAWFGDADGFPVYAAPVHARPVVHAVRCTYPQCQATNGCVGACSKTTPVHASDISQERVDETAKDRHEHEDDIYDIWVEQGTSQENRQVAKNATTERVQVGTRLGPSQDQVGTRIWVGLTDEEKETATGWSVEDIEAKLKEKNT